MADRVRRSEGRVSAWGAAGAVAALMMAILTPLPASAAPGGTTFFTSFESGDAAPVNTGTGEAGSMLGAVSRVQASAENAPGEVAANLADGDAGTKWLAFKNTGWVQYDLSAPQPMVRYTLTSGNDEPDRDPRDFRVLGSDDGSSWTVLDQRQGEGFDSRSQTRTFELAAPAPAYAHYRLEITATKNPSKNIVQLAGWEPIVSGATVPSTSYMLLRVGAGPTSSDTAKTGVGFTGTRALQYTGHHLADGAVSSTTALYTGLDVAVASDSRLSYLVFPVLDAEQTYAATFVAVDLHFDDGSTLSASGATDVYGFGASAKEQGMANGLWPNQWNKVSVDLGRFAGRTVTSILFTYDHPVDGLSGVETPTRATTVNGWLDDVAIGKAPVRDDADGLVSYVDTRRGTNSSGGFSRGNNLPAAAMPNGFNFLTPMTNADNGGTLYNYQRANNTQNRPTLNGIGFSHEPSIWMGDRNQLAVMPAVGSIPTSSLGDRALAFRHDNELARPDIYRVAFDNGISTAVTPTDHGAVYRFTFVGDAGSVLVDQVVSSSKLTVDGSTVTGWVDGGSGWPGRTRMFVYGTFDRQPTASGATNRGDRNGSARYAAFDTSGDRDVELRIASSFISQDQARANHGLELDGVSFDDARRAATAAWNDRLDVVHDVKGATDDQLVTLYSSLYRLNLYPNSQFENTGTAQEPHDAYASPVSPTSGAATDTKTNAKVVDGRVYVNNGFWDTYRTAWPLYALLYPKVTEDLADGFVQQYRDGGWIARWSSPGYADLMTGTSSDVAFAEAYLASALDTRTSLEAYDAAVKNATVLPPSNDVGRKGIAQSTFLGFTTADTHESASWGLEGYINDFGISKMAAALAEDPKTPAERVDRLRTEAVYFGARAQHYVEMFNPDARTFTARNADGSWTAGANFDKKAWGGAFTEASAWTFGYHAPYDVDGLASLYGGRQGLVDNLHAFLAEREKADRSGIHEAREARDVRLGMLGMSNQVAHHIPYVLAEAGDPVGAQELIRSIQKRMFVGSDIGQGYPGDEDNGEFSAWYVFSALGFYPLKVGSGDYTIGTPLFDSATLSIGGKDLVIEAPGASSGKDYVAGVRINGTEITDTTFDGDLLRAGGTLSFTMSSRPTSWGAKDLRALLEAPRPLLDATKPGRGKLSSLDGTPVGTLVDDTMNSQTTFPGTSTDLVWTSASGPVTVGQYTLTSVDAASAPASWTLSGSTDGTNWTQLDHREGATFDGGVRTRPFSTTSLGSYTSFKLSLTSAGAPLAIAEVELFASASALDGLSVTAVAPQRVAIGAPFTGVLAMIVGAEKDAAGYDATVDYGDGTAPVPAALTRDELGGWRVSAPHDFAAPGSYTATISVRDTSGRTASASASVAVYRDDTFAGALNVVCIGDLGTTAASCDGLGYGYDRAKLAAHGFVQGQTLPVPGTALTYDLPAVTPGAPDNLTGEGQTVRVNLGAGATQLAFVGTATEKERQPTAILHFTDGSQQQVSISFGDWVGSAGSPRFGNSVVAVSEGRLSGTGAEGGGPKNTAIYATAPIVLDAAADGTPKTVESLTMPKESGTLRGGRVHVFAIASDGDRSGIAPLTIEPAPVADQVAGTPFRAVLATVVGGVGESSAVVNWGDGSTVSAVAVADGAVSAEHVYAAAGSYTAMVTADDGRRSAEATVSIAVTEPPVVYTPSVAVAPEEAHAGDVVEATGSGFAPRESVAIRFGLGDPVTVRADDQGALRTSFTVSADALDGDYPVVALGDVSKVEARAVVHVRTATTGPRQTAVVLRAGGDDPVAGESFPLVAAVSPTAAAGKVEFLEGDAAVGSASASAGTATAEVRIETAGSHVYIARFTPDDPALFMGSISEPLTVVSRSVPVLDPELVVAKNSAAQGESVDLTGRGFAAGESVVTTLHSDPVQLATAVADEAGGFRLTVTVPTDVQPGKHTIVAQGSASGLSASASLRVIASGAGSGGVLPGTGGLVPVALGVLGAALLAAGGVLIVRRWRPQH
ncbi:GH92 family glycosyl hydrolase [Luethyella okanaganae]|uniref:GH92 family glycosyl hydrolase n=1 Tax=Luethyella okanaganae TaxID=69372 RepID=A0ABW1VEX0_9MICO